MSTDFAPLFEKKFHDKVVPGLLHLMDDNANPRVQAHAGAALGMVSNNMLILTIFGLKIVPTSCSGLLFTYQILYFQSTLVKTAQKTS